MKQFAVIGNPIGHSLSPYLHNFVYNSLGIDAVYERKRVLKSELPQIINLIKNGDLSGINVTIPHKENIMEYLDNINPRAQSIGAVNIIINNGNKLIGHNTDIFGFEESIAPLLNGRNNAIILGNGGASKAIAFVFYTRGINFSIFSRNLMLKFADITEEVIQKNDIIINTPPLGMYPNADSFADLQYNAINTKHLLYDLVYNPEESQFLKKGMAKGAQIKNGKQMLYLQAEKSWKIWNLNINL